MSTTSSVANFPEGILSPTGTGKTPVPVVAHWFTHSDFDAREEQPLAPPQSPRLTRIKGLEQKSNSNLSDDFDNRSVKSDATVVENKTAISEETVEKSVQQRPEETVEETIQQRPEGTVEKNRPESPSTNLSPPTPSQIRKKFQQSTSFDKNFERTSELELSEEFYQGIRGKVKETKESFMRQPSYDKLEQAKENREAELQALKHHRLDTKQCEDVTVDKSHAIRQEKVEELQNLRRSRSKSRPTIDNSTESCYSKEMEERASELASLSNRKVDLDDASLFSPTELKEIALREERERELAALCGRQTFDMDESLAGAIHKENLLKAERCLELAALSERNFNSFQDSVDKFHPEGTVNSSTVDCPGSDGKSASVRETMACWQQREQSAGKELRTAGSRGTPTRRIGSMFRREQDYWADDDDLPAPPPEEALQPTTEAIGLNQPTGQDISTGSMLADDLTNPPPPPRQSSRGKVEEYRHWSGGWTRGWTGSNTAEAHHKLH